MAIDNLTPELKFAWADDCDTIGEHHERYLPDWSVVAMA